MDRFKSLFFGVFLPGIVLAFAIPVIVFLVCALLAGLSVTASIGAVVEQFSAERHPLLGAAIVGLLPVVLVAVLGWLVAFKVEARRSRLIAQAGLAGIAAVLLWVNFSFWPGYLPERAFRGFPHGLEFVIGPLFFAPPAMLACMAAAWFATRAPAAK